MDLQSFSLFNQLPCEIRTTIWFYAMTPATVYATPVRNELIENPRKQNNPCLLRVCSESRTACLQRYQLAPDIEKTYVNFDLDTIYIEFYDQCDYRCCFPTRDIESWPQIHDLEWLLRFGMGSLLVKLSQCPKLRKATFVVKSTAVDEEYEVDITNTITKYEDMERTDEQLYVEQFGEADIRNLDFSRQYEAIAIWWAGSLYK